MSSGNSNTVTPQQALIEELLIRELTSTNPREGSDLDSGSTAPNLLSRNLTTNLTGPNNGANKMSQSQSQTQTKSNNRWGHCASVEGQSVAGPRDGAAVAIYDGQLYIFGGDRHGNKLDDLFVYRF